MKKGAIFLGDLADAVRELGVTDVETIGAIAALLDPPVEAARMNRGPLPRIPDDVEPADGETKIAGAEPQAATGEFTTFYPTELSSHPPEGGSPIRFAPPPQQTMLTTDERNEKRPELQPLLRPYSRRAILSAALSSRIPMGIDVPRTIALLSRREPLEHLPIRTARSVRRGVQLLVDKSSGMVPFLADQAAMAAWIRDVIGRQRVETANFTGSPEQGLLEGARNRRAHIPPAAGTPVVLLTDLGIAEPHALDNAASPDEWVAFARRMKQAGCPVIAFVPYPPERWPRGLDRVMTILQWDRPLTASRAAKVSAR